VSVSAGYVSVVAEAGVSENHGALEALARSSAVGLALSIAIGIASYLLLQTLAEFVFSSKQFTLGRIVYVTTLVAILLSLIATYVVAR